MKCETETELSWRLPVASLFPAGLFGDGPVSGRSVSGQ